MKKYILIVVIAAINILFFQNFTTITEQEKESWGAGMTDADNSAYDDFQSALKDSQSKLDNMKKNWKDDFEESDAQEDEEVGAVIGDTEEAPL